MEQSDKSAVYLKTFFTLNAVVKILHMYLELAKALFFCFLSV